MIMWIEKNDQVLVTKAMWFVFVAYPCLLYNKHNSVLHKWLKCGLELWVNHATMVWKQVVREIDSSN